jgi:hypothetical protein
MYRRLREQAPLPHWVGDDLQIFGHCKFLWEQSLLAMAVDQLHQPWTCRRLREQALLPQVLLKQI